jgi:hypothetical protein
MFAIFTGMGIAPITTLFAPSEKVFPMKTSQMIGIGPK